MEIEKITDDDLISLRVKVDGEMQRRGLSFSVGEFGERLAINFFNSTSKLSNLLAAQTGVKNVDAWSRDGERYSIKTALRAKKTGTIYPDSEQPEKPLFEYLLIVILTSDYQLHTLYQFSWKEFLEARSWDKRMNAWYIPLSQKRLSIGLKLFDLDENN